MSSSGPRKQCRGNLRPAPFSITPAVVRSVIALSELPHRAVTNVPIKDVDLVEPRRSAPRGGTRARPIQHSGAELSPVADIPARMRGLEKGPATRSNRQDGPFADVRQSSAPERTNARNGPTTEARAGKIDLNQAPSAMERLAATWRKEAGLADGTQSEPADATLKHNRAPRA